MIRSAASGRSRERVARICDSAGDARALRLQLVAEIRQVVSFDAYAWLLTDPETSVGSASLVFRDRFGCWGFLDLSRHPGRLTGRSRS